jgi:hypothetical protein
VYTAAGVKTGMNVFETTFVGDERYFQGVLIPLMRMEKLDINSLNDLKFDNRLASGVGCTHCSSRIAWAANAWHQALRVKTERSPWAHIALFSAVQIVAAVTARGNRGRRRAHHALALVPIHGGVFTIKGIVVISRSAPLVFSGKRLKPRWAVALGLVRRFLGQTAGLGGINGTRAL